MALLVGNYAVKGLSTPHVLGTSTSNLIADQDIPDGQSVQHNGQQTPKPSDVPTPSQNTADIGKPTTTQVVAADTKVDCTGPDGTHFTTSFHDCQQLNLEWGNSNFLFTPLSNSGDQKDVTQPKATDTKDTANPTPELPKTHYTMQTAQGKLEVQTDVNKGEFNLQGQGTQVQIKAEDNGALAITAQNQSGEQVSLKENAIEQINKLLDSEDIHVSTLSAHGLAIEDHNVVAHTTLPITVDPTTKTLSVTTPAGTKDVAVLPSQAVQQILGAKVITNVLSQASSTNTSGPSTPVIGLTIVNNQPAFAIQGVLNTKLLGIFPVAYQKTVYVSAQDGQVLQVSQSVLNQLLETISF